MRIVVCVKEVLDPDAVNNYVLSGNLKIGEDGKTLDVSAVPRLMNGYDEQALERRSADPGCGRGLLGLRRSPSARTPKPFSSTAPPWVQTTSFISMPATPASDCHVVANLLSAYIRTSGGADLVFCGRQASDDDQGVVPALIGETLEMPVVPLARAIEVNGNTVKVTRVTPDGDEVVEGNTPAVVTISNELGEPRFPTARAKMAARKKKADSRSGERPGPIGRGPDREDRTLETARPPGSGQLRVPRRLASRSRASPHEKLARRQPRLGLPRGRDCVSRVMRPHGKCFFPCFRALALGGDTSSAFLEGSPAEAFCGSR